MKRIDIKIILSFSVIFCFFLLAIYIIHELYVATDLEWLNYVPVKLILLAILIVVLVHLAIYVTQALALVWPCRVMLGGLWAILAFGASNEYSSWSGRIELVARYEQIYPGSGPNDSGTLKTIRKPPKIVSEAFVAGTKLNPELDVTRLTTLIFIPIQCILFFLAYKYSPRIQSRRISKF